MEAAYNIAQSYEFNYAQGPAFSSPIPAVPTGPLKSFLGLPVRSRLGISAGLLLNSKWIAGYAQRGFDILTYKTVRSSHRPAYPMPNWVFAEERAGNEAVFYTARPSTLPENISSAVCFGMPSMAPEVWREDIKLARAALSPGQILIVSIVATPREGWTQKEMTADFCQCAEWAAAAGAHIVEANFSCPNVCSAEGSIYHDAGTSRHIALALKATLGNTPLLLKVGYFAQAETLRAFLHSVDGVADGITLVNCVVRPVLHSNGEPVFGKHFVRVGVAGRLIHQPSLENARLAIEFIKNDGLHLSVVGNGGASTLQDMDDFFRAGVDAVVLGSSPMYLPNLAAEAKRLHPEW
jgi:dihydroorotate dehydrogenase (NAD+) catalytic subunit